MIGPIQGIGYEDASKTSASLDHSFATFHNIFLQFYRSLQLYIFQIIKQGEEMEMLITGKSGKARRYKLHPIIEQSKDQDAYVMNASGGEHVVIQGITINDHDEAFSESGSNIYTESSSTSTVPSGTPSGVAIDTTVGDCKVIVNQTFQSTDNELGVCIVVVRSGGFGGYLHFQ